VIERIIQGYLADRHVAVGETVQAGWLMFHVVAIGPPIELQILDFKRMASFTRDLTRADEIYRLQHKTLERHQVEEELCTFMHSAIVSKSYKPGHVGAFIKRDEIVNGHSSGWYVGILEEPLSMEDEATFELRSLYELSISDERMIPFWLMPVGTSILLEDGTFL
jgi:hypothetical protein